MQSPEKCNKKHNEKYKDCLNNMNTFLKSLMTLSHMSGKEPGQIAAINSRVDSQVYTESKKSRFGASKVIF